MKDVPSKLNYFKVHPTFYYQRCEFFYFKRVTLKENVRKRVFQSLLYYIINMLVGYMKSKPFPKFQKVVNRFADCVFF